MDTQRIDTAKFQSDSINRDTYWACASTTIGAALHELGHTFGLPHSNDPRDMMTRGFDYFNRAFTFVDPESRINPKPLVFKDETAACFAPISASALVASPWFTLDDRVYDKPNRIKLVYDEEKQAIVALSPDGIRYLGAMDKGDMRYFTAPRAGRPAPTELVAKLDHIRKAIKSDDF